MNLAARSLRGGGDNLCFAGISPFQRLKAELGLGVGVFQRINQLDRRGIVRWWRSAGPVILPPELTAAICALRHLRSGCTLLHHNGFDDDGVEGARRAHVAIKT